MAPPQPPPPLAATKPTLLSNFNPRPVTEGRNETRSVMDRLHHDVFPFRHNFSAPSVELLRTKLQTNLRVTSTGTTPLLAKSDHPTAKGLALVAKKTLSVKKPAAAAGVGLVLKRPRPGCATAAKKAGVGIAPPQLQRNSSEPKATKFTNGDVTERPCPPPALKRSISSPPSISTPSSPGKTKESAPPSSPRSVSFGHLYIRTYDLTLGDHPSCTFGPPLTLGWNYSPLPPVPVDEYENVRSPRRRHKELGMDVKRRRDLLMAEGYTEAELKKVERVRLCRVKTSHEDLRAEVQRQLAQRRRSEERRKQVASRRREEGEVTNPRKRRRLLSI